MMSRRKLFYLPGAISLLALYPLLMWQLDRWKILERYYTIETIWFEKDPQSDRLFRRMSAPGNYQTVTFTGHAEMDRQKMKYAKKLINTISARRATRKLVRFRFADTAKYDSFVQLINLCEKEENLLWIHHQNDCWVFNRIHN